MRRCRGDVESVKAGGVGNAGGLYTQLRQFAKAIAVVKRVRGDKKLRNILWRFSDARVGENGECVAFSLS